MGGVGMGGLPTGNRILNSKERKKLLQALTTEFGISELPEGVYLQNAKDKVFLINRDLENVAFEKLLIDSLGLYMGGWQIDGFRLSMEGAQLLRPHCKKGIITLSTEQRNDWLLGKDLIWDGKDLSDTSYFVIVTYQKTGDVLGCGKIRQAKEGDANAHVTLMNFVPKARRLHVINE